MEKVQTPVVAGVSGAAVLAALLSFGSSDTKRAAAPQNPPAAKQSSIDESEKGTAPNQEGPWRAVCEEYAPNGDYKAGPTQTHRGYVRLPSDIPDGTVEYTTKQDPNGRAHKIAVHKQLVGDLVNCVPKPELSGIHLVIDTLPDPDKTEMRLEFDRYVDALEKAAAIRRFHYTGYWFPWSALQTGPVPHKEDEVEAALLRAEQPGVLLFHNDQGERLFIFVVGETATTGINRMQMVQALRYRQALIDASRNSKAAYPNEDVPTVAPGLTGARLDGPLMISGPHFSGALKSLAEVLQESRLLLEVTPQKETPAPDPSPMVKIISPDASSEALIETFDGSCNSKAGCSFRSLGITATAKDRAAVAYLGELGYRSEQIAHLVEDESGFGDSERNASSTEAEPFGLVLTFPRELSAVRSLSDQQSEQLAESGAKLLSFSKSQVPIKLAGQGPIERDRPSTFAPDAEASEISNALEDDVRVLRENDIQCIVISATNPLDRIFLLEYIHDRLPNVRAVAEDADELEVSHPHFIDLTGTIVISSLPTVPEFAAVRNQKPSSISFASVSAEEQFLSTALLLDDEVMKRDITKVKDDLQDEKANGEIREDGWRVSIAGEEGFELIPLAENSATTMKARQLTGAKLVFGIDQKNAGKHTEEAANKADDGVALEVAEPEDTPRVFFSFSIAIFLLTALHLVKSLNSERPRLWRKVLISFGCDCKDDRPLQFAYVEPGGQEDPNRTFNLLALNNQVLLLNCLVLVANPVLIPFDKALPALGWIAAGAWAMVIFSLAAVIALLMRSWGVFKATIFSRQSRFDKLTFLFFSFLMIWYRSPVGVGSPKCCQDVLVDCTDIAVG